MQKKEKSDYELLLSFKEKLCIYLSETREGDLNLKTIDEILF